MWMLEFMQLCTYDACNFDIGEMGWWAQCDVEALMSGSPRSDWYVFNGKYIPIHSRCIGMYLVCIAVCIQNPKSVLTTHVLSLYLSL